MAVAGRWVLDARLLVWLLALVFATGLPLMLLFDGDTAQHANDLQKWRWLRSLHTASTLALLAGAVWHLARRFSGSRAGIRSGGWLLIAVGVATATGALAAQTSHADAIARTLGLAGAPAVVAAVAHIAYATILVLLFLYLHVARWGWRRVFGDWRQAAMALVLAALLAWVLPAALPGAAGGLGTALVAPPVAVLFAWPILLGAAVWALRGRDRSA